MIHHHHDSVLVVLSVLIAIFASYTALDLANSISAARGKARYSWLLGGSLAMGIGIWSMHFVAMLAFSLPGIPIAYDVPLLVLSILVAIAASTLSLYIVTREKVTAPRFVFGSIVMGGAICGMHYIGIASMRLSARYVWDSTLVWASIAIAVLASFVALMLAFKLRNDLTRKGFLFRGLGAIVMGLAIAGMHYTAMMAMTFHPDGHAPLRQEQLLATSGLAISVIGMTLLMLGIAVAGSILERMLARRAAITEQVQNQQRWLESVLNLTPTPLLLIDPDTTRVVFANKAAHEMAGSDFFKHRYVRDVDPEYYFTDTTGARVPLERTPGVRAARGEKLNGVQMLWHTPRAERALILSSDTLAASNGHEPTAVLAFNDVTKIKEVEAALQVAVRNRDEFISVASHELKTPITSMRLNAQLLERSVKKTGAAIDPPRLLRMLETSTSQLDRLARLVDDMLDISRATTGRLTMEMGEHDLTGLVEEVAERFEEEIRAAGSELRLELEPGIAGVFDQFRIDQVVTNLLSNAIKYAPGKPIEVKLRKVEPDLAEVRVRDHGQGIPEADRVRVFERFERLQGQDGSRKGVSGLGLGLYIVRNIIEGHRGSIRVESELGRGAEFIARIPLRPRCGAEALEGRFGT